MYNKASALFIQPMTNKHKFYIIYKFIRTRDNFLYSLTNPRKLNKKYLSILLYSKNEFNIKYNSKANSVKKYNWLSLVYVTLFIIIF